MKRHDLYLFVSVYYFRNRRYYTDKQFHIHERKDNKLHKLEKKRGKNHRIIETFRLEKLSRII